MHIDEIVKDIEEASFDIPFENSIFQTDNFVVNGQLTRARAYRAILLRLNNRLQALREAKYRRAMDQVDDDEAKAKIDAERIKAVPDVFAIRRLELEQAKKQGDMNYTDKLINDALVEIAHLYSLMKKFPRYTRAEFEAEERKHFEISLQRQANGLVGARASLIDMQSQDAPVQFDVEYELKAITNNLTELLQIER